MKKLIVLLLCIALTLAFVTSCSEAERPLTVAELLEVAERYLLEGNYEQALVEFMRVIEVEPREPRGYTGAADALIGLGRYDEARAILEQGLGVLPDNAELQGRLEGLYPSEVVAEPELGLETELESEPEPEPEFDLGFLSALPDLLETDGFEALEEALDSGEFNDLINQIETFPMIRLEECGTRGVGVYNHDGDLWIYIGEFYNQMRSGHGILFSVHTRAFSFPVYFFEGEWRDDLPNGSGTVYFLRDTEIISGTIVNGLWHGFVTATRAPWWREHIFEFDNGIFALTGEVCFCGETRWYRLLDHSRYADMRATVSYMCIGRTHGVPPFSLHLVFSCQTGFSFGCRC